MTERFVQIMSTSTLQLLVSVFTYHEEGLERLLQALKTRELPATTKRSNVESEEMEYATKVFRDRYSKYLRKRVLGMETIRINLDACFGRFKVTVS
jgi:hypothetical protein